MAGLNWYGVGVGKLGVTGSKTFGPLHQCYRMYTLVWTGYNLSDPFGYNTFITTTTQLIGLPNHNSIHLINHHSIIYTESINMSHISRYKCTHTVSVTFTVRWLA